MRRTGRSVGVSDDSGFSLAELLVVVSLLGIVIAAAYMFLYMVNQAQAQSDREALLSKAVGQPLLTMEKLLLQNSGIDHVTTGDYQLSGNQLRVYTDGDPDDSLTEQHTFTAVRDTTTGKGYVNLVTYLTNSAHVRQGAARINGPIAFDNANIDDGVDPENGAILFRYYDSADVEITDMSLVSANAASVVVQLRVIVDDHYETHSDTIQFRNRSW